MSVIDWHTRALELSPHMSLLKEDTARFCGPDKNVQPGYKMKFNLFSFFSLSSFLHHLLCCEASDHLSGYVFSSPSPTTILEVVHCTLGRLVLTL